MLRRRPDDWDGTLPTFRDIQGDEYQVPTLISRDGVHPSYPRAHASDFSERGLSSSGYNLRSYLALLAFDQVIEQVLDRRDVSHRGRSKAVPGRPAYFPHRIWAACDFEGQTPDYTWFGSADTSASIKTGMNPVPGPMMGEINKLYLRYYLKGISEATFQHYSLTTNDNCHIRASDLVQNQWSETTLDFTRAAQRNDGSQGVPFQRGERMDDFQVYVGQANDSRAYEMLLDDVIFFADDPNAVAESEPFPNRVILLAAFDTGIDPASKPKYWPGEFDILSGDQAAL